MTTVYLALGSNVGDSRRYIAQAIDFLGEAVDDIVEAPICTSKAVGYTQQADFLNTAIAGVTDLDPHALLRFVKDVERRIGRIKRFRWGPREIDIDIILYGDVLVQDIDLTIPHPRFAARDFVLEPLCALNPTLVDPRSHQTIRSLLEQLPDQSRSVFL